MIIYTMYIVRHEDDEAKVLETATKLTERHWILVRDYRRLSEQTLRGLTTAHVFLVGFSESSFKEDRPMSYETVRKTMLLKQARFTELDAL